MPEDFEDLPFEDSPCATPGLETIVARALAPVRAPAELDERIAAQIDTLRPRRVLRWAPRPEADPALRRYQKLGAAAAAIILGLLYVNSLRQRPQLAAEPRVVDVDPADVAGARAGLLGLASSFDTDLVRPVKLADAGAELPFDLESIERQFRAGDGGRR